MEQTTALRKIASLNKRIWVIRGGQGSGKTFSILTFLCGHASNTPNKEILIVSSELTKMRLTVIKDFKKVMRSLGIFEEHRFLAETLYKFPNGSFIKFIGLDKEDVGKGLRSDIAYFNEVNKIDVESYRQVASRTKRVVMDYNPDAHFWVDEDIIPREDADFLQLTFEDNEQLPQEERNEILNYKVMGYNEDGSVKNEYWANTWEVYGLGNIGKLHGVVYTNWEEVDEMPTTWKWKGYGLDWGFSLDPCAFVEVCYFDGAIWVNEIAYEKNLTNTDLATKIEAYKREEIIADSAEPKSVEDFRRMGFRIRGCKKGADSIRAGIKVLQKQPIKVTRRSTNIIKELSNYKWQDKKDGVPEDRHNHALDAIRYICSEKQSRSGVYNIR